MESVCRCIDPNNRSILATSICIIGIMTYHKVFYFKSYYETQQITMKYPYSPIISRGRLALFISANLEYLGLLKETN